MLAWQGPSPRCRLGVSLPKGLSIEKVVVKHLVGLFGFGEWCRQPHLEHLGVFVYVGNKGDSGSLIEKNVWVLMFLSDIISQNLNNECCSSGLGWVSKNCLYA